MISRSEVLMGRDKEFPLNPTLETHLEKLLKAVNVFRAAYGKPMIVSSGYRPGHYNADAHGAKNSPHIDCQAVDFSDKDGEIKQWAQAHIEVLEKAGLYMEHPKSTPTWCHLQIRPTLYRIFLP
jgi:uncharacterized protein YcbK (DUF882 family)